MKRAVWTAALAMLAGSMAAAATPHMPLDAQRALVEKYCLDCHNFEKTSGGVEFETFDPANAADEARTAERMIRKLGAGMMPPAGKPRPDFVELQAMARTLEETVDLTAAHKVGTAAPAPPEPRRIRQRRARPARPHRRQYAVPARG